MAITVNSVHYTYNSGGSWVQDVETTLSAFPSLTDGALVMGFSCQGGSVDAAWETSITLGGEAPDYVYHAAPGSGEWWKPRLVLAVWLDATIASMSGTDLDMGNDVSTNSQVALAVVAFEGVDQTTPIHLAGTFDISGTGVDHSPATASGECVFSVMTIRVNSAPTVWTYNGDGTSHYTYETNAGGSDTNLNVSSVIASGASVSQDMNITATSPHESHGYLILNEAAGGGGITGIMKHQLNTIERGSGPVPASSLGGVIV